MIAVVAVVVHEVPTQRQQALYRIIPRTAWCGNSLGDDVGRLRVRNRAVTQIVTSVRRGKTGVVRYSIREADASDGQHGDGYFAVYIIFQGLNLFWMKT